jgi:hypothetical protein
MYVYNILLKIREKLFLIVHKFFFIWPSEYVITKLTVPMRRSQWPRCLRRRSTAARLLRLWFRMPLGAWKFVCCDCCLLSGRGLCDGLITRPEESYRLWRVVLCDQAISRMRRLKPATGLWKIQLKGL